MTTAQQDMIEAAQYAADIFGALLGLHGYATDMRMDFSHDRTTVSLEILLTPQIPPAR
jgi:hypothetical protein